MADRHYEERASDATAPGSGTSLTWTLSGVEEIPDAPLFVARLLLRLSVAARTWPVAPGEAPKLVFEMHETGPNHRRERKLIDLDLPLTNEQIHAVAGEIAAAIKAGPP